jgi:hypothetical protein
LVFKTITFGSLAFPFSEDLSEGLVEEQPGVLRFYLFGAPRQGLAASVEDSTNATGAWGEDEGDAADDSAFFDGSRCSSSDSLFDDARSTTTSQPRSPMSSPTRSSSEDQSCSPRSFDSPCSEDSPLARGRTYVDETTPSHSPPPSSSSPTRHEPRLCSLCGAGAHSPKRCPARCTLRRCHGRLTHALGTCHYRLRVCELCGERGHGQERCTTVTTTASVSASDFDAAPA